MPSLAQNFLEKFRTNRTYSECLIKITFVRDDTVLYKHGRDELKVVLRRKDKSNFISYKSNHGEGELIHSANTLGALERATTKYVRDLFTKSDQKKPRSLAQMINDIQNAKIGELEFPSNEELHQSIFESKKMIYIDVLRRVYNGLLKGAETTEYTTTLSDDFCKHLEAQGYTTEKGEDGTTTRITLELLNE